MAKTVLMQGNEAAVEGAIAAGMRFFAGYPITPSTEIAEGCALRLPQEGGKFIQMEDEISSIAAVLGGTVAALTAIPEGVTDSVETLGIYTGVFTQIGLVTLGVTVLMAFLVPVLNKLINKTDETEEEATVAADN